MGINEQLVAPKTAKQSRVNPLAATVLASALIIAVGTGVYYWQHHEVDNLDSQLKTVTADLNNKAKEYNSVNAQLQSLGNNSKSPLTQSSLQLSVVSASRYTPDGNPDLVNQGVAVQIELINKTTSTINVVPDNINLLDVRNNSYNESTFNSQTSGYALNPLPNKGVALNAQTIAPQEVLRGTLLFIVSDTSLTKFTLVSGSQTYPVNLSN